MDSVLYLYPGTDFVVDFFLTADTNGTPINIENFQFKCWMRKSFYYEKDVYELKVIKKMPYLAGSVQIFVPASKTIDFKSGRYVFDLNVYDGMENTLRLANGIIVVQPSATQSIFGATGATGATGFYPIQKY